MCLFFKNKIKYLIQKKYFIIIKYLKNVIQKNVSGSWKKNWKIIFYSKKVKTTNTLETKEMQTEKVRLVKYDRLTIKWRKKTAKWQSATRIIFGFLFAGKMRWKKKELGFKELLLCFT
jgi:hypothetical protein